MTTDAWTLGQQDSEAANQQDESCFADCNMLERCCTGPKQQIMLNIDQLSTRTAERLLLRSHPPMDPPGGGPT